MKDTYLTNEAKQDEAISTHIKQYPPLLTKKDMAELLRRSVRTIYRLERQGQLPSSTNVGSQRLWGLDEVQKWITAACPPRRVWERLHPKYRKSGV
jgi:excisionase family DNA binding protein